MSGNWSIPFCGLELLLFLLGPASAFGVEVEGFKYPYSDRDDFWR